MSASKMIISLSLSLLVASLVHSQAPPIDDEEELAPLKARWCVVNDLELRKCRDLAAAIRIHGGQDRNTTVGAKVYKYIDLPALECIKASDQYECMEKIFLDQADLIQLETGLSYTAGEYYNMVPLVAEKYVPGEGDEGLSYYAVAVVRKDNPSVTFNTTKGKTACFPGVGRAAGWIYPVSELIDKKMMDIVECNVPVKSAEAYFDGICAPDALQKYYNPFGNNPTTVCQVCTGEPEDYCTCNDPYAGFSGAFKCMATRHGDLTFVRNTTVYEFVALPNSTMTADDFELLCLDGSRAPVDAAERCNWGSIASHVIMTSMARDSTLRDLYKTLLLMLSIDFGENGQSTDLFRMFESIKYGRQNLMFSDESVMLKDVSLVADGTRQTYYRWAGEELHKRLIVLNYCPIPYARWCVISNYEMMKCESMVMAFTAKKKKVPTATLR